MTVSATSSLRDFIIVIDDGLPAEYSQRVLDQYADCDDWTPGTVEADRSGDGVRNCDLVDMSHPDTLGDNQERHQLLLDATSLVKNWAATYEDAVVPIGLSGRTGLGLARYRTGGYYRSHNDGHPDEARTLTMVAVVDSDFTGGELSFFRGGYVLDLQPGQVCLFPATFQYPHAVEPVVSGTRYSMISWLR